MFAIFPLNRISFRSGKMHYTVVSQIKCDAFLQLFPLQTELKGMKLSTNSSPYPVTFHFFHLKSVSKSHLFLQNSQTSVSPSQLH